MIVALRSTYDDQYDYLDCDLQLKVDFEQLRATILIQRFPIFNPGIEPRTCGIEGKCTNQSVIGSLIYFHFGDMYLGCKNENFKILKHFVTTKEKYFFYYSSFF